MVVRLVVVKLATVLMLLWPLQMLKLSNLSLGRRLMIKMIKMIKMIQMIQMMQVI